MSVSQPLAAEGRRWIHTRNNDSSYTQTKVSMKRQHAAKQAKETLGILVSGRYYGPSGKPISIRGPLETAIKNTVAYSPTAPVQWKAHSERTTQIQVENRTTLSAAHALASDRHNPVVLSFASARRPGGGFKSGSQAQEESLARASGMYACIEGQPMYSYHREQNDPLYSSYALYSPDVPVFRDDPGSLLSHPYQMGIISCAAPNAGEVPPKQRASIPDALDERIRRVLAIGLAHDHDSIVLGAWGCGVFRNGASMVSQLFHDALHGEFRDAYARVTFAVLDRSTSLNTLHTFERALTSRKVR